MKSIVIKLSLLAAFMLIGMQLSSCDKLKDKVKGSIAGQVRDANGVGMGYTSVAVIDAETGQELTRETTNNEGGYFITELRAGTYNLQVWNMGTQQLTITSGNDTNIKLGVGRTETIDLVVEMPSKTN
jgi:hypothetical protein